MEDPAKNYWFEAKRYGWGWTPASREGWLIMLAWILAIVYISSKAESVARAGGDVLMKITLPIGILTALLLVICYKTGERPSWHWGDKDKK